MTCKLFIGSPVDAFQGAWLDVEGDELDMLSKIEEIADLEDWEIQDSEGFRGLKVSGENLENLCKYVEAVEEHGEAFQAYVDLQCDIEYAVEKFEEAYLGTWSSVEEYAENFLEDTGALSEMPDNLRYYFDFEKFGRDLELGGDISSVDTSEGVAIFCNHV